MKSLNVRVGTIKSQIGSQMLNYFRNHSCTRIRHDGQYKRYLESLFERSSDAIVESKRFTSQLGLDSECSLVILFCFVWVLFRVLVTRLLKH